MENIEVKPEVTPESQEHIDEMVKKVDEQLEQSKEQELLAGKYKSEEDLQKGILELMKKQNNVESYEELYKNLEKGLGKKEEAPEEEVKSDFDFTKFEDEIAQNGALGEDSYKELAAQGFPKRVVDAYMDGLKAQADKSTSEIYNIAGGKEGYQDMINWAAEALNAGEIEEFNNALATPAGKFAVEALYNRYVSTNGKAPKLVKGNAAAGTSPARYESRAQMIADMGNPMYKSDPAFRAEVAKKIQNSDI